MDRTYLRPPIHVIWGEILHFKHPERFVCMYVCMYQLYLELFRITRDLRCQKRLWILGFSVTSIKILVAFTSKLTS